MAEQIPVRRLTAFTPVELGLSPNRPMSLYRGVCVLWDDDRDPRVLWFIDALEPNRRARLLSVAESKGTIALVWNGPPPADLCIGKFVEVDDPADPLGGDSWVVAESRDVDGDATWADRPKPVASGGHAATADTRFCVRCGSEFFPVLGPSDTACARCADDDDETPPGPPPAGGGRVSGTVRFVRPGEKPTRARTGSRSEVHPWRRSFALTARG